MTYTRVYPTSGDKRNPLAPSTGTLRDIRIRGPPHQSHNSTASVATLDWSDLVTGRITEAHCTETNPNRGTDPE